MKIHIQIVIVFLLLCVSCQPKAGTKSHGIGFDISFSGDTTHITVYSPWQSDQIMARHVLTKPLERVICFSATHIGFINELDMMGKVVGVPRPDRVYSFTEEDRLRIKDLGDDMQPNMEAILLANPDAVIISTYGEGDDLPRRLETLGIPIFYCNEWMEQTPLARAEWIRFFGACLGCLDRADSVYNAVSEEYKLLANGLESNSEREALNHLEQSTGLLNARKASIMSGMSFRGTWYVPAGGTFMGHLFRDAGAVYCYDDNPSSLSIPLTLEQALQDFAEADVWVGCTASSMAELQGIDQKHTWFKAYQAGEVYNFYRRTLPSGANDFWESGTVHPERILQDLQYILQGDTSNLYYASPLH